VGARGKPMKASIKLASVLIASLTIGIAFTLIAQEKKSPPRPVFKVGVETVFVRVAVCDPQGRYVTGLEKEHFRVFEDKVEQTVSYFGQQTTPISVGIIFDVSASMKDNNNIRKAKSAIVRFLQSENPDDESLLITFNNKVNLAQEFTSNSASVRNISAFQKPGGSTAVYDAVYLGLEHLKRAKNEKKALILITDGEDNSSRYSPVEVREFAKESDVQVYGIGEQGKLDNFGTLELQNIVNITGGRAFFPTSFNELDYYIDLIHAELRNQYLLGYSPSNLIHDGKWRKITVKLEAPQGLPKLAIHARDGYYAPKN
jgi:Ca-activated chloride channel family protein